MTGFNPCTLAEAGVTVAKALGNADLWTQDRDRVVETVNKCRNEWFNQYSRRKLFFDASYCVCVSCYSEGCGGVCSSGNFHGFSLPGDMDAVTEIYESGEPITIRSQHREAHAGLGPHGRWTEAVEIAKHFPTQRDPAFGSKLKVFAESPQDSKKKVTIKVVSEGVNLTLVFTLQGDGWVTVDKPVDSIESVVLPNGLAGRILLAQTDGRELSEYDPVELVPSYRRYKLQQPCDASALLIRGTKRYRDIWCDTDLVEIGDKLVIDATARHFRYSESSDRKELQTAQFWLTKMNGYLDGVTARSRGGAIQDGTMDKGRPVTKRTRLPGYGATSRRP